MGMSTTHLLMLVAVVVILFGRNKISDLMGDVAKGIKSFKKGIADDPAVEIAHDRSTTTAPREGVSQTRP